MSNLGFQTLYGLLKGLPDGGCERLFADINGSVESGRPADAFAVLAFSVSFEGDYPALARMLHDWNIPPRASERDGRHPLILSGGIAPSLNPEPLAPLVDILLLGEAEGGFAALHAFLRDHKDLSRQKLLQTLAAQALPGVYVPAAYRVEMDQGRVVERRPVWDAPDTVEVVRAPPVWPPAHSHVVAPDDAFGGAYLLEISRGCPHGCRFCAAGYFTRPTRFIDVERLLPFVDEGIRTTGRVGLVGAAISDHPGFDTLAGRVADAGAQLTVSSFRAENLTDASLSLLIRGGMKTLTVALEGGSDRLRARLGKGLGEAELLAAARLGREHDLKALRIYAMVGLPGEETEDVTQLAELAKAASDALGRGLVTLSVAPFVPKPHTPFQWEPMAPRKLLKEHIRELNRRTDRHKGVRVNAESPKWARVQGLLSRGGRDLAELLDPPLDGGGWSRALRSPAATSVLDRPRERDERFPWDFLTATPSRTHLWNEREASLAHKPPKPCPGRDCTLCALCPPKP